MADERIIIEVGDEVSTTPADKFRQMAREAVAANNQIEKLKTTLSSLPTSTLSKIASEQTKLANATARVTKAREALETASARNAVLEQRLATEAAKTSAANAQAEIAATKLAAAREREAAASAKSTQAAKSANEEDARRKARIDEVVQATIRRADAINREREALMAADRPAKQLSANWQQNVAEQNRSMQNWHRYNKVIEDPSPAEKVLQSNRKIANSLDGVNRSLGATRRQMLTLQATAVDVVGSITSGMSPLRIALQQGPQLAIRFSEQIGTLASRVGILGGGLLTAATALGVYSAASISATNENARLANALEVSGNYAALTTAQFRKMTSDLAENGRSTVSTARGIAEAFATSGQFQQRQVEESTASVLKLSKLTGKAAEEITKSFLAMAESPIQFAENTNKSYNYLTSAQLNQIRTLQEMGNEHAAMELASRGLYEYLQSVPEQKLHPLTQAWNALGRSISNAWTNLKDFTGETSDLTRLQREVTAIESKLANMPGNKGLEKILSLKRDELALEKDREAARQYDLQYQAESAQAQREGYASSRRLADQWGVMADNSLRASNNIEKFRSDIAKALAADPTDKWALNAQKNQAKIEEAIRKQSMPQGAKQEESRAMALAKINAELQKQLDGMGVLRPQREIQQQLDQYEIDLASKKITLSQKERAELENKLKTIQNYNAAQQATDRIYEEVNGPAREYQATVQATEALLKSNVITQTQANQQLARAKLQYEQTVNPLMEINRSIEQQIELIKLAQPQREIAQQMQQVENQLRSQGITLGEKENENLRRRFETLQQLTGVQQQYDQILSQTTEAQRQLQYAVEATNLAYQNGVISQEQYSIRMNNLGIQAANLRIQMGQAMDGDAFAASFGRLLEGYNGTLAAMTDSFGDFFVTLQDGFANSIAGAIMGTESLGDALRNVATSAVEQLIASLVKMGVQWAVNAALSQTLGATATATSVGMAAATSAAWATPAALVSLASYGANAVPAQAGIASTVALTSGLSMAGFEKGGYTGNGGTKQVAGVVHGKEFVMDAVSTARIGVSNLQALQDGRMSPAQLSGNASVSASRGSSTSGSGNVNVTVINNSDNSTVRTEETTNENGETDIRVMIDNIENTLAARVKSGRGALVGAFSQTFGQSPKPSGGRS